MRSHSLLSRLAYTLCIRSPNVGASHMAHLCHPLLDGRHGFLKRSPCGQTGSVYGYGPPQASHGSHLTSKGCKGMLYYTKVTHIQPLTT